MVVRHLLVIYDMLAGCGDYVASCGCHNGLDRGYQPRKTEEGVKIRCVPPFLLLPLVFWKQYSSGSLISLLLSQAFPRSHPAKPCLASITSSRLSQPSSFPVCGTFFLPGPQGGHPEVSQCWEWLTVRSLPGEGGKGPMRAKGISSCSCTLWSLSHHAAHAYNHWSHRDPKLSHTPAPPQTLSHYFPESYHGPLPDGPILEMYKFHCLLFHASTPKH